MDLRERSLLLHEKLRGKIGICSKVSVKNAEDLSLFYSPGVAEPCLEIAKDPEQVYRYTGKGNLVAVITDGTAVLGLGDIGPLASLPVMEGKALLFKEFAGVDAVPICLATKDVEEILSHIVAISPSFGGINLEDISAPRCFEIEERLKKLLDIPVFHDDQHGTAIVVLAGLQNALRIVGKKLAEIKLVVLGPGAAGTAITRLLKRVGVQNILVCNKGGILSKNRRDLDSHEEMLASLTNPHSKEGDLAYALEDADVLVGVSVGNIVTKEMISSMAPDAIVFALANPDPEILPLEAKKAGARIVATGRSDYPNQVNNVLGFPGIFRGALDARAKTITEEMKIEAAKAIANLVPESQLHEEYIIPAPFCKEVVEAVAFAVRRSTKTKDPF